MNSNELATKPTAELSASIEQVVIGGDLSALNPQQRVQYYNTVCQSVGLNPYTRPFDYIRLNGKLTLYARKDATDQLRKINGVNIDDINTDDDGEWFVVTVKGSDRTGRRDVEIGAVNKKDMQGNFGNAMMKAVTKAKRRLTLSLCGLGWLDETEVETIPTAQPVIVDDSGNIAGQARIEEKAVIVENPTNNTPKEEKPVEAQEKPEFDANEFLRNYKHRSGFPTVTLDDAKKMQTSQGKAYGDMEVKQFYYMSLAIEKKMSAMQFERDREPYMRKLGAVNALLTKYSNDLKLAEMPEDPFTKGE